jgi:hypothetical protein
MFQRCFKDVSYCSLISKPTHHQNALIWFKVVALCFKVLYERKIERTLRCDKHLVRGSSAFFICPHTEMVGFCVVMQEMPVCSYYSRTGRCKYGSGCK